MSTHHIFLFIYVLFSTSSAPISENSQLEVLCSHFPQIMYMFKYVLPSYYARSYTGYSIVVIFKCNLSCTLKRSRNNSHCSTTKLSKFIISSVAKWCHNWCKVSNFQVCIKGETFLVSMYHIGLTTIHDSGKYIVEISLEDFGILRFELHIRDGLANESKNVDNAMLRVSLVWIVQ